MSKFVFEKPNSSTRLVTLPLIIVKCGKTVFRLITNVLLYNSPHLKYLSISNARTDLIINSKNRTLWMQTDTGLNFHHHQEKRVKQWTWTKYTVKCEAHKYELNNLRCVLFMFLAHDLICQDCVKSKLNNEHQSRCHIFGMMTSECGPGLCHLDNQTF